MITITLADTTWMLLTTTFLQHLVSLAVAKGEFRDGRWKTVRVSKPCNAWKLTAISLSCEVGVFLNAVVYSTDKFSRTLIICIAISLSQSTRFVGTATFIVIVLPCQWVAFWVVWWRAIS